MTVTYYMDVNVHGAVTAGLRLRGVDVLTAQQDGRDTTPDPDVLDRAGALGRVVVTYDSDFLAEATARQQSGRWFVGVLKAEERDVKLRPGRYIDDLELIAAAGDPADYENRIEHLPLRPP